MELRSHFYGRRKGRGAQSLREGTWNTALNSLSLERWQKRWPSPLWMEIGFGYGEHLLSWLAQNPTSYAIGVEVFETGLIHCIKHLRGMSERCALFSDPVAEVFPLLSSEILDGIFILFPDPWPKQRHHKRRLIQGPLLNECHRILKSKGVICFASDHSQLVHFTLTQLQSYGKFEWKEGVSPTHSLEWPLWPETWPISRYHQKALAHNKPCAYSVWEKV